MGYCDRLKINNEYIIAYEQNYTSIQYSFKF